MKTSIASKTLVSARAGMAIAAFALAGCAVDDLASEQQVASAETAATMSVQSGDRQPCAGQQAHTLFLQDADGKPFRLVHIEGCGWKRLAGETRKESLALPDMSFAPIATSHADASPDTASDPMTVFIDGPTGYTFVWTAEDGWKFVGHLSDAAR